jgi:hypothetical protein
VLNASVGREEEEVDEDDAPPTPPVLLLLFAEEEVLLLFLLTLLFAPALVVPFVAFATLMMAQKTKKAETSSLSFSLCFRCIPRGARKKKRKEKGTTLAH